MSSGGVTKSDIRKIMSTGVVLSDIRELMFGVTWTYAYAVSCIILGSYGQMHLLIPYSIIYMLYFVVCDFFFSRHNLKNIPFPPSKYTPFRVISIGVIFICTSSLPLFLMLTSNPFHLESIWLVSGIHLPFSLVILEILKDS
jgi:hypothetical protein